MNSAAPFPVVRAPLFGSLVATVFGCAHAFADGEPPYEGRKKCGNRRKNQYKLWRETTHATAFDSRRPGIKGEAKRVRDWNGMDTHFELQGVFGGQPRAHFHDEFQATAMAEKLE